MSNTNQPNGKQTAGPENMEEKKVHKKRAFLLLLLLTAAVIVIFYLTWNGRESGEYGFDKSAKSGILENDPDKVQEILNQTVAKGMFNISINPQPVFPDGKSEGDLRIENIPANHYYTKVSITLESGEKVFQSGGLKPGQYIKSAKLDKPLKKGDYPATASFVITNPEDMEEIGTVNAKITLHIRK